MQKKIGISKNLDTNHANMTIKLCTKLQKKNGIKNPTLEIPIEVDF